MKIKDRGFWVSHHFYWQSLAYYFYYSARFRSFTFFSAGDPAIDLGGMLDESKSDIYELLPSHLLPLTIVVDQNRYTEKDLALQGLTFPLIIKPNIGFRGYKVVKVDGPGQLNDFLAGQDLSRKWLIQEYLDYEREFSLLFYRYPHTGKTGISSLIEKVYPSVTADGERTIGQMIASSSNPFLDRSVLQKKWAKEWNTIPQKGKKIILDYIGNYSRGAKFHSLQSRIDQKLVDATTFYFRDVRGLDFFRMDFKCNSLDDYVEGKFRILEVNGMKSEPLHIYDPQHSFLANIRTIHQHWKIIRDIVKERKESTAYRFPSTAHGLKSLFAIKRLVK